MRHYHRPTLVLALSIAALIVLAPGASGSFGAPTNFPVPAGAGPTSVVAGEFNGDIFPDLAVANFDGANISVLLGAPGGTYGPANNIAVGGSGPISIAIGEFSADSDPDLAVAYLGKEANNLGGVSVLLGGPGGSFAGANFIAGDSPGSVAVRDFNGDSEPDLAVSNRMGGNVSVLLGAPGPSGSFGAPTNFSVGVDDPLADDSRHVAVGDFNGDSDPDLVVANRASENIAVLLGGAGGSFGPATNFNASNPRGIAVADFNGDSDPDLAVTNFFGTNISVLLGGAGGSFGAPTSFPAGPSPYAVAAGNLNGDSDPDLVVANHDSDDISVLLGGPGGTFAAATNLTAGNGPSAVAVHDLTGDSRLDLAVTNDISDDVSVFRSIIDTPLITATSPASPANDNSPEVRGSGAEPGSTVKLYGDAACTGTLLGSGPAAAFNGPTGITANVPSDQTTNLRATATDVAGNASACSAAFPYAEDSTPPDTQIDSSPPNPSSDSTGDFTFSSTGGASSFECRVDTGSFSACSSPHATAVLADASHTFEVRAIDAVGNIDPFPASYTWTVDTVPVATPTINDTDPDSPANDNNPEVKGFGAEANSTVSLYSNRSCTNLVGSGPAADFNGATGLTVSVPDDLTTNMWVTATDPLGTVSGCTLGFSYTEDSTAPMAATINDTDPDSPSVDLAPEVKGFDAEANATVRIYSNRSCSILLGTGSAANFNGATGITATVPSDQTTTMWVGATDQAGNSSCSFNFFSYANDSTAPAAPTISDLDPDSPANDNSPEVKGSGAEPGSTVTLYASADCTSAAVATGTPAELAGAGITINVGDNTTTAIGATATDAASNRSPCSAPITYVEDSAGPAVSLSGTDPASPANENAPKVKGTVEAGATVTLYASPDCTGTPLATGGATTLGGAGIAIAVADDSTTAIRATGRDAVGNTSSCSAPITYIERTRTDGGGGGGGGGGGADTTAPETTATTPKAKVKTKKKKAKVVFDLRSTEAGSTFECSLDGAAPSACTSPLTMKLKKGKHTLEVVAIDRAGNRDRSAATVAVKVVRKRPK